MRSFLVTLVHHCWTQNGTRLNCCFQTLQFIFLRSDNNHLCHVFSSSLLCCRTVTLLMCSVQVVVYLWFNVEILQGIFPKKPICYQENSTRVNDVLPFNKTHPMLACILPDEPWKMYYLSQPDLDTGIGRFRFTWIIETNFTAQHLIANTHN